MAIIKYNLGTATVIANRAGATVYLEGYVDYRTEGTGLASDTKSQTHQLKPRTVTLAQYRTLTGQMIEDNLRIDIEAELTVLEGGGHTVTEE